VTSGRFIAVNLLGGANQSGGNLAVPSTDSSDFKNGVRLLIGANFLMHVARLGAGMHSETAVITLCGASATRGDKVAMEAYLEKLDGLGKLLVQHGLRARLIAPPGRLPSLHVVNPVASVLAEDVYAGPGQDGLWWFWWSWAERIAAGEDVEGAAVIIEHVLAANS